MTMEDRVLTNEVHIKCLSNSIKNVSAANGFRATAVKDAPPGTSSGNRNPGTPNFVISNMHFDLLILVY